MGEKNSENNKEMQLENLLKKHKEFSSSKNIKVTKVNDNVFFVEKEWIWNVYIDKDCKPIINISAMRNQFGFKEKMYLAGFRELSINGNYYLYSITDIDSKTWNPIKWAKYIDSRSFQYYKAWESAILFDSRIFVKNSQQRLSDTNEFPEISLKLLDNQIKIWSVKIEDIESYHRNKQISENVFYGLLTILKSKILLQCSDLRFVYINQQITKKELDWYFARKRINKDLYDKCIESVFIRDRIVEEMRKINNVTQENLKNIRN